MTARLPLQTDLDMQNQKITNVAAPTDANDAATRQFVLDNAGGGGDVEEVRTLALHTVVAADDFPLQPADFPTQTQGFNQSGEAVVATSSTFIQWNPTVPQSSVSSTEVRFTVRTTIQRVGTTWTATQPWMVDATVAVRTDSTLQGDGGIGGVDEIPLGVADDAIGLDQLSATGTPSTTTFLRGDNTWATPPTGGGTANIPINLTFGTSTSSANLSNLTRDDADRRIRFQDANLAFYTDNADVISPLFLISGDSFPTAPQVAANAVWEESSYFCRVVETDGVVTRILIQRGASTGGDNNTFGIVGDEFLLRDGAGQTVEGYVDAVTGGGVRTIDIGNSIQSGPLNFVPPTSTTVTPQSVASLTMQPPEGVLAFNTEAERLNPHTEVLYGDHLSTAVEDNRLRIDVELPEDMGGLNQDQVDDRVRTVGDGRYPRASTTHETTVTDTYRITNNGDLILDPADQIISYHNVANGVRRVNFPNHRAFQDFWDKINGRFFQNGYGTTVARTDFNAVAGTAGAVGDALRTITLNQQYELGRNDRLDRGELWPAGTVLTIPTEAFRTGSGARNEFTSLDDNRKYFITVNYAAGSDEFNRGLSTGNRFPRIFKRLGYAEVQLPDNLEEGHNWALDIAVRHRDGSTEVYHYHSDAPVPSGPTAIRQRIGQAIIDRLARTPTASELLQNNAFLFTATFNIGTNRVRINQTEVGEDFTILNATIRYFQVPTRTFTVTQPVGGTVVNPTSGPAVPGIYLVHTSDNTGVQNLYTDGTTAEDGFANVYDFFISHDGILDLTIADDDTFDFGDLQAGDVVTLAQGVTDTTNLSMAQQSYTATILEAPARASDHVSSGIFAGPATNNLGFEVYRFRMQLSDAALDYFVGTDDNGFRDISTGNVAIIRSERPTTGEDRSITYRNGDFRSTNANVRIVAGTNTNPDLVLWPVGVSTFAGTQDVAGTTAAIHELGHQDTINQIGVFISNVEVVLESGQTLPDGLNGVIDQGGFYNLYDEDGNIWTHESTPRTDTVYIGFDRDASGINPQTAAGDDLYSIRVNFHVRNSEGWYGDTQKQFLRDPRFSGSDTAPFSGSFATGGINNGKVLFRNFHRFASEDGIELTFGQETLDLTGVSTLSIGTSLPTNARLGQEVYVTQNFTVMTGTNTPLQVSGTDVTFMFDGVFQASNAAVGGGGPITRTTWSEDIVDIIGANSNYTPPGGIDLNDNADTGTPLGLFFADGTELIFAASAANADQFWLRGDFQSLTTATPVFTSVGTSSNHTPGLYKRVQPGISSAGAPDGWIKIGLI